MTHSAAEEPILPILNHADLYMSKSSAPQKGRCKTVKYSFYRAADQGQAVEQHRNKKMEVLDDIISLFDSGCDISSLQVAADCSRCAMSELGVEFAWSCCGDAERLSPGGGDPIRCPG